ncbi:MAG: hypothetical protein MUC64_13265 [Rubritepida sp.]|nr:hypothetical protein [Rubritepida sp.]
MITRRDLLAAGAALAALPARAQQAPREEELLRFTPLGQVTLLHIADLHAQLTPVFFREPATNIGVGAARGQPPHLVGEALLAAYEVPRGSAMAHALTHLDFAELARRFGPMGGVDRTARILAAIRAERPGRTLLLDGGDAWQGSWGALQSRGADIVAVQKALGVEAMVGHWEFTYGAARVQALAEALGAPFLAGNVQDSEWNEDVFPHTAMFERGGVPIAVLHAARQPALAGSRMVLRHQGGEGGRARGGGARGRRRAGGAALAQRLRRGPAAGRARAGHRRDPDGAYA